MKYAQEPQRSTDIIEKVDLPVTGASPSGIPVVINAIRKGFNILTLGKYSFSEGQSAMVTMGYTCIPEEAKQ